MFQMVLTCTVVFMHRSVHSCLIICPVGCVVPAGPSKLHLLVLAPQSNTSTPGGPAGKTPVEKTKDVHNHECQQLLGMAHVTEN
jgi:hypothetical protein